VQYSADATQPLPAAIPANTISARFFIADWGTQFQGAQWDEVKANVSGTTPLSGVNNADLAANSSQFVEVGPWLPPDPCIYTGSAAIPICAGRTPTKQQHQCIKVQLAGAGVDFTQDTIIRNMDFATASHFDQDAVVSIKGLPSIGKAKREVLLNLEALDMPDTIPGGITVRGEDVTLVAAKTAVKPAATTDIPWYTNPIYRVNAFYDTGATEINPVTRKKVKVYAQQTSFGFFVSHVGKLYGWNKYISGADEINPRWYRVGVPNDGQVLVNTGLDALEQERGCNDAPDQPAKAKK
jgi:hypothetical protein